MLARALGGAGLTLVVSLVASTVGPAWSGLLAAFPVLSIVLGGMSCWSYGADYTVNLFHGMARGFYALGSFSLALTVLIEPLGAAWAYGAAWLASALAQWLVMKVRGVGPRFNRDTKPAQ